MGFLVDILCGTFWSNGAGYQGICGQGPNYQLSETSVLLYRKDKFNPIGDPSIFFFNDVVPGHRTTKVAVMQLLEDKVSKEKVAVASVHLPWEPLNNDKTILLQYLQEQLSRKSRFGRYIICGDFNVDHVNGGGGFASTIDGIFDPARWADAIEDLGVTTARVKSGLSQLDWMLYTHGSGLALKSEVVKAPANDLQLLPHDQGEVLSKNSWFSDHAYVQMSFDILT
jgi:hypothetical protein